MTWLEVETHIMSKREAAANHNVQATAQSQHWQIPFLLVVMPLSWLVLVLAVAVHGCSLQCVVMTH
jgi:hypothetical protein